MGKKSFFIQTVHKIAHDLHLLFGVVLPVQLPQKKLLYRVSGSGGKFLFEMFPVIRTAGMLIRIRSPGIGIRELFDACHDIVFLLLRTLQQRVFQIFIHHKIFQLLVGEGKNIQGLHLAGGKGLLLLGGDVIG